MLFVKSNTVYFPLTNNEQNRCSRFTKDFIRHLHTHIRLLTLFVPVGCVPIRMCYDVDPNYAMFYPYIYIYHIIIFSTYLIYTNQPSQHVDHI